jgi:hypothetical protein
MALSAREGEKMENGKWEMENGKWEMESGKWKMESGRIAIFEISSRL